MIEEKTMCLGQINGRCQHCKIDTDKNHNPNNYDCPNYKETKLITVSVEDYKCDSMAQQAAYKLY